MARILVIEDDPVWHLQATEALKTEHEVHIVPTKKDAIPVLTANKWDLIILDLNLSDSAGKDTLDAVQKYSTAPVVIVTAGLGISADKFQVKLREKHELLDRSKYLDLVNTTLEETATTGGAPALPQEGDALA